MNAFFVLIPESPDDAWRADSLTSVGVVDVPRVPLLEQGERGGALRVPDGDVDLSLRGRVVHRRERGDCVFARALDHTLDEVVVRMALLGPRRQQLIGRVRLL